MSERTKYRLAMGRACLVAAELECLLRPIDGGAANMALEIRRGLADAMTYKDSSPEEIASEGFQAGTNGEAGADSRNGSDLNCASITAETARSAGPSPSQEEITGRETLAQNPSGRGVATPNRSSNAGGPDNPKETERKE